MNELHNCPHCAQDRAAEEEDAREYRERVMREEGVDAKTADLLIKFDAIHDGGAREYGLDPEDPHLLQKAFTPEEGAKIGPIIERQCERLLRG